jgi:hypothetical protein
MRIFVLIVIGAFTRLAAAPQHPILVEEYRYGSFSSAECISTDAFGCVYVSDGAAHTVTKFDSLGRLLRTAGGPGWEINQFDHPQGIDARLGIAVYIADRGNHRIVRCDRDLNPVGVFAPRDDPAQTVSFGTPMDVANSGLAGLCILDGENKRIVTTSGFAVIENSFGGDEAGAGKLRQPSGLAIDRNENLFVLDDDRVVVFDAYGNYRRSFGDGLINNACGIAADADKVLVILPGELLLFGSEGDLISRFGKLEMVFASPPGDFRDAVFFGSGILLLSTGSIIMLRPQM